MTDAARRAIRRATFFLVPALALLLALGTWQVQRRAEKHALLAAIEANAAAPPLTTLDDSAREFRRVRLTGTVQSPQAMGVGSPIRDGVMGVAQVVPLTLPDGRTILIDRGWRAFADNSGPPHEATISGMLRRPQPAGWVAPENRPADKRWFRIDPVAIAAVIGVPPERMAPFYVMEDPAVLPEIPDNHLQYAFTWYAFAATLLVIYVLFVIRARREGTEP